MVLPTDGKNWWYWIHFISEYYCPEYGWVRAETSYGETPWETKNDIVLRVIYPKDENKVDPYFRRVYNNIYTSGEEMWFWIHTDNAIVPNGGTDLGHYRAGGWIEKHFYTEEKKATEALFITNKVFDLYAKRFSKNYEKWLLELKKSISSLEKNDIGGYINQMESIYQELKEEELKELSFLLFRKFGRKSKF
jgi:ribosomal protein S17E